MSREQMEKLLGLGKIATGRTIPGLEPAKDMEFCYISESNQIEFPQFFKTLVRHVTPPIPKNGGAVIEGCRIVLPDGEAFQAISYRGDISEWREQISRGAKALKSKIARIVNGELQIESQEKAVPLEACKIEFD